ncbi:MAG: PQQ-binding-like beta-propeller repeat protein, partial [Thermoplasmata archaeon]|nr:PQQ-binding-like beta-propeller repeat protein [Thermoplasmata archaeon]
MKREHFPIIFRFSPAFILSLFLLLAPFPWIIIGGSTVEEDVETYQETDVPEETRTEEEHQWSMFKHDLKHTGQNPNAINENPMRLRWKTRVYDTISSSSPVINNQGQIYIGTNMVNPNYIRKLYSIFPNGSIEWTFDINRSMHSTPALDSRGNIYVTTVGHYSKYDSSLYSVFANGSMRWALDIEDPIKSSPVIYDDTIYIASMGGTFYAINMNGTIKWTYKCEDSILSTPSIDSSGIIYFGSEDTYLYAFYTNGTIKWRYKTEGAISSTPCIDNNGIIYTESRYNHFLYAVFPNGSLKWKSATNGVISDPSIDQIGNIYVGSDDHNLHSYFSNGTFRWKYTTADAVRESASIDGLGNVYFGSYDSYLYYLNKDGELIWKYKLDSKIRSTPSIDNNGNVYIGSYNGWLYSIGTRPPREPQNASIELYGDSVHLEWDIPSDNGGADINGYRICKGIGNSNYTLLTEQLMRDDIAYLDYDIVFGTNYSYYIVAFNREGEGNRSEILKITPIGLPSVPLNVISTRDTLQNNISWSVPFDNGGSTIIRYNVQYSENNSTFQHLGSTETTNFIHEVTSVGKIYYYMVNAENEVGISIFSDAVPSQPIGPPLGNLMITISIQNASIVFRFDPPYDNGGAPITHYVIRRDGVILDESPYEIAYYNDT